MTARTSEKKRNAFLRAFAATGNQTLAAEQAGVSRSTVRNLRRADAGFDARWRSAQSESARRLGEGGSNRPPRGWERRGAAALVVQRARKRPPQVVRSLRTRWTPRSEDRFLGQLRRCNNLRLACDWAGMTLSSYEAHWRRWPDFRRRVSEARAFGSERIEAEIEARAEGPFDLPEGLDDLPDFPPGLTIADLINLARRAKAEETMRRRRAEREGGGARGALERRGRGR